jgi:hypothetical protein
MALWAELAGVQGLVKYYDEQLGVDLERLVPPDVAAVAKDRAPAAIVRLAQLVLGCCVKAENNQLYIANIMQMGAEAQRAFMSFIEEVRTHRHTHTDRQTDRDACTQAQSE